MGEFEIRKNKIRDLMVKKDIDVLLIYSNCEDRGNVRYVTNYDLAGKNALAILPRDGESSLLITLDWDLDRAKELSWTKDVRISDNLWKDSKKILSGRGLLKSKIGLVGERGMNFNAYTAFKKEFPNLKFEPADSLMQDARRIHTDMEIKLLRRLGEVADAVWKACLNTARVGVKHYELMAEMEYAIHSNGADSSPGFIGIASGPSYVDFAPMRSATEKRIEEGDMLCIEITPADKPYSIQFVTTLVVGDVSKERMEKADYLIEGIREAEAAIKPGTPLSEMAKILNDSIARAGCWEFCRPPFTLDHRGHGQSINITEYNDMKMEKGMEFVVHPIQYFPDVGGMMFGDHVLVTDKGYERMFQTELKLFSIPRGGL